MSSRLTGLTGSFRSNRRPLHFFFFVIHFLFISNPSELGTIFQPRKIPVIFVIARPRPRILALLKCQATSVRGLSELRKSGVRDGTVILRICSVCHLIVLCIFFFTLDMSRNTTVRGGVSALSKFHHFPLCPHLSAVLFAAYRRA